MKKSKAVTAVSLGILLMAGMPSGAAKKVFAAEDAISKEADFKGTTVEELHLEDGEYRVDVTMKGGSGRASIESPTVLEVKEGEAYATIIWSSSNYDYMKVNDVLYTWEGEEEFSTFQIPVDGFDYEMAVIADTVAMSTPHEIEYTLNFDSSTIVQNPCIIVENSQTIDEIKDSEEKTEGTQTEESSEKKDIAGLVYDHSLKLSYADQFSVDYYQDGYKLLTIADVGSYLLVPEGKEAPEGLDEDIEILSGPFKNIYLVATSAMDFFNTLDSLDTIRLSGTDADGWYIEEAKQAIEDGEILFAGKYSAPDYERIINEGCDLAIESTMILHSPEVMEQLEQFGIPVLIEHSSYESHPLGRMEWLKFYGALLGKEDEAEAIFEELTQNIDALMGEENTGKTVAFFYINSNGLVNVRKSDDYIAKMIEIAGGNYIFSDLTDDNSLSTMNMQMEDFYAGAKDADYIIYNSTIDGELDSLSQLFAKSELLADFKAVKEGNVWCTKKNLFQESTGLATMIEEIHQILTSEDDSLTQLVYMNKLQ